jgi:hypothetical protein
MLQDASNATLPNAKTNLFGFGMLNISGSAPGPTNSDLYASVGAAAGSYSGTYPNAIFYNLVNGYAVNSTGGPGENTRVYTNIGGTNQHGGFLNFDTTLFVNQQPGDTTNFFTRR